MKNTLCMLAMRNMFRIFRVCTSSKSHRKVSALQISIFISIKKLRKFENLTLFYLSMLMATISGKAFSDLPQRFFILRKIRNTKTCFTIYGGFAWKGKIYQWNNCMQRRMASHLTSDIRDPFWSKIVCDKARLYSLAWGKSWDLTPGQNFIL